MAIRKIAKMGHPVLRRPARAVSDPASPEIRALVADMVETMEDANGAGLAAPQIHEDVRVVIFHVPAERASDAPDDAPEPLTVLINPVVEPLTEERELGLEGCLSVPGFVGAVPRFTKVRYSGYGLDGRKIEREASGFHARVVQHECDHLDGILYPQRMEDLSLFGYVEEVRRALEARGDAQTVEEAAD
jgi:peptide deformylase